MTEDATTLTVLRAIKGAQFACLDDLYAANLSVFLTGPEGHTEAWRDFDPEPAQRAAAAFGLTGGELCGCHAAGCDVCASNGGCGDEGCGRCESSLRQYRRVVEETNSGKPRTGGTGGIVMARAPTPVVDAHCHLNGGSLYDWANGHTALDGRITDTYTTLAANGATSAAVSTLSDAVDDATDGVREVLNGRILDLVTARAAAAYPGFFIPMARNFRVDDRRSRPYIQALLDPAVGFEGLGELLVHDGSNGATKWAYEANAVPAMVFNLTAAANAQKIVLVHWNIGSVDATNSTVTCEESYDQLTTLLEEFPKDKPSSLAAFEDPMPLKMILAHCGAGPYSNPGVTVEEVTNHATFVSFLASTYSGWLDTLIATYPNLYFDLAGMQTGDVEALYDSTTLKLTELGDALLLKIIAHPDRFLVGSDTQGTTGTEIEGWTSTLKNYETFLSMVASDGSVVADPTQVLSTNFATIQADVLP